MNNDFKVKIAAEKALLKAGTALIENEEDKKFFKEQKKAMQAAESYADTPEMEALLHYQYASTRNKLIFLLFRTGVLTEELEKQFRALLPIEEVAERYQEYAKARQEKYDEENKRLEVLRNEENHLEIFKGLLNGMSVEQAEEKLKQQQEQMKQLMSRG